MNSNMIMAFDATYKVPRQLSGTLFSIRNCDIKIYIHKKILQMSIKEPQAS